MFASPRAAALLTAAAPLPRCSLLPRSPPAVVGVLRGFDQLVNLVLDDTDEFVRGE